MQKEALVSAALTAEAYRHAMGWQLGGAHTTLLHLVVPASTRLTAEDLGLVGPPCQPEAVWRAVPAKPGSPHLATRPVQDHLDHEQVSVIFDADPASFIVHQSLPSWVQAAALVWETWLWDVDALQRDGASAPGPVSARTVGAASRDGLLFAATRPQGAEALFEHPFAGGMAEALLAALGCGYTDPVATPAA